MKRICLLAVVITALVLPVMVFGIGITIGPKVMVGHFDGFGDDYNDFIDNENTSRSFNLGIPGGVFVEIGVMPFLAIQMEVLFTVGGLRYEYEKTVGMESGWVKGGMSTYTVDLPILVKGKLGFGHVGVFVLGGPGLQARVGTWTLTEKSDNGIIDDDLKATGQDKVEFKGEDFAKDFGFSLIGGAGVELSLGPGVLMVDARYCHGLTEWFKDDDTKYRAFLLSVGYGFKLM